MKQLTSFATFALVLTASAIAIADAPTDKDKDKGGDKDKNAPRPIVPPPPFASLPLGTMTTPPKDKAPTRIPKAEKVEGFYVADPPKNQNAPPKEGGPTKITNVIIFAKEEDAKDYTAGKGFGNSGTNDETLCFTQPPRTGRFAGPNGGGDANAPPPEWSMDIEPNARISAPMKPPPPRKKDEKPKPYTPTYGDMDVTAIHQERFFQDDKKARIEIVDAWVDPMTHGVRLISKATMPLERIGSAYRGVRLYAARGEKVIHVVARRDRLKEATPESSLSSSSSPSQASSPMAAAKAQNFRLMNAARQPLMIEMPSGEHDQTQCGFAHVVLKAQQGFAETAMFETSTVFLDAPEPGEKEKENADALMGAFGFGGMGNGNGQQPTVRVRPFRATVSSTWSSKDAAPVISVSFGWAGREREM